MVNRIDPKIVSLSLVIVSVILSLLCAISIAVAPEASVRFLGSIFHGIDMTKIASPMTINGVLIGIVAIAVVTFVAGWLFATMYNFLASKMK